jgi:Restriction Enzyme Adenine Methylase Associated
MFHHVSVRTWLTAIAIKYAQIYILAVEPWRPRIMPELRTIEIDLDVHKLIEAERETFAEPPNNVLRRLLKIDTGASAPRQVPHETAGAWTGKRVTLPAGTLVRMEYRGQTHRGEIRDSSWLVDGRRFESPSAAAGGVARTKHGRRPSLDGWKYWHAQRPGESGWTSIDALRQRPSRAVPIHSQGIST